MVSTNTAVTGSLIAPPMKNTPMCGPTKTVDTRTAMRTKKAGLGPAAPSVSSTAKTPVTSPPT